MTDDGFDDMPATLRTPGGTFGAIPLPTVGSTRWDPGRLVAALDVVAPQVRWSKPQRPMRVEGTWKGGRSLAVVVEPSPNVAGAWIAGLLYAPVGIHVEAPAPDEAMLKLLMTIRPMVKQLGGLVG